MADLDFIQSSSPVVVVGATSTGLETTPVQSTVQGGLHVNLRNNSGTEIGTSTTPVVVAGANADGVAPTQNAVLAAGKTAGGLVDTLSMSNNNDLYVSDTLTTAAVSATLAVSTTAVECKVGASPLANRKTLVIQAQGTNLVYGFSSGSQLFNLPNGTTLVYQLGPGISIWVRRTSGTTNVAIAELS